MPSSSSNRKRPTAFDRRSWCGGRQRGVGWLRGAGWIPRRVQWDLDAIRLQLQVRAKARFWWLPQVHRLVEGEQGPHPTGDGGVGLRLEDLSQRITGPEAHALGRALAHGPTRLVMDKAVRHDGWRRTAGTVIVSPEGVEFVASGRLARLMGRGDMAISMADLLEVDLEPGRYSFRTRRQELLVQTRGDRRLRIGLGELLAEASREGTPDVRPEGFVESGSLDKVLQGTSLPHPPPIEVVEGVEVDAVVEAEPVLVPASVHDAEGRVRPGRLLLRTRDLVWVPRSGKAEAYHLRSLTLGSREGGRRVTIFRANKPISLFFAEDRVANRFEQVLTERLAWSRTEETVDLDEFLKDAALVELEAEGMEVLALAPEDLVREESVDGFEAEVERGWNLAVGGRVRVQCLTDGTVRWCKGVITASQPTSEQDRVIRVRPVGIVEVAERVRREDHRVEIDDVATVYMLSTLDEKGNRRPVARALCQVVDLSASGIGLRMRSGVHVGDKLRVEVALDDHMGVFDGRVVYVRPDELGSRVGMSFLVRGERQRKRLAAMLLQLESKRAQEGELAEDVADVDQDEAPEESAAGA